MKQKIKSRTYKNTEYNNSPSVPLWEYIILTKNDIYLYDMELSIKNNISQDKLILELKIKHD